MKRTCMICYYFEDDWNQYAQCWCTKYRMYTDIDAAERCSNFQPGR